MAENETIILEVNLDVGKVEDSLTDMTAGFKELNVALNSMAQAITNGFDGNVKAIQRVESGVQNAGKTVSDTVKNTMDTVTSGIDNVAGQLEKIFASMGNLEKLVEGNPVTNAVSFTSDFTGIFSNLKGIFGGNGSNSAGPKEADSKQSVNEIPKTNNSMPNTVIQADPYKNEKGQLLLPGPVDSSYKGTDTDGLVSGLAAQMGNLASSGGGMETLAAVMEDHISAMMAGFQALLATSLHAA